MNQFQEITNRIMDSIKVNSSGTNNQETRFECDICHDTEWIINRKNNSARPCQCLERKTYKRIIESSGITEAFLQRNFESFVVTNQSASLGKNMAKNYIDKFNDIKSQRNNSIAFLGQVGSGKTHLSIAISNELMSRNIGVRYMQYREDITKIKQVAMDEISYNREISKYKNATVLLIDDLYKNATYKTRYGDEQLNDADKRAMFEIINFRYFKGTPVIISSEYYMDDILHFDEGIGSRILEMCKGHTMEFHGKELNYRLYNDRRY